MHGVRGTGRGDQVPARAATKEERDNFRLDLEIERPLGSISHLSPPRRLCLNNTRPGNLNATGQPRGVKLYEKAQTSKIHSRSAPEDHETTGWVYHQRCTHYSRAGKRQWLLGFRGRCAARWTAIPIAEDYTRCNPGDRQIPRSIPLIESLQTSGAGEHPHLGGATPYPCSADVSGTVHFPIFPSLDLRFSCPRPS